MNDAPRCAARTGMNALWLVVLVACGGGGTPDLGLDLATPDLATPDLATPADLATPDLLAVADLACAPTFGSCVVPLGGRGDCCPVGGCTPPNLPRCTNPSQCTPRGGYMQFHGCGIAPVCTRFGQVSADYNRVFYQVCQERLDGTACRGPDAIESMTNTACLPCCP